MIGTVQVNSVGIAIDVQIVDSSGIPIDISTASSMFFIFREPSGHLFTVIPSFLTDGTDGWIRYVTVAGDLDEIGTYQLQAQLCCIPGFPGYSQIENFESVVNLTTATPAPIYPNLNLLEDPQPALSLEEWREEMSFQPWHFWGLSGSKVPSLDSCSSLVAEYAWQDPGQTGRSELRTSILEAERKLLQYLRYNPAPHYVIERHPWPRYPDPRFMRYGYAGSDGRWMTIQLNEGKINAAGVETLNELALNEAVTFLDADGDGINETFTMTVTLPYSGYDESEIGIYFNATDRLNGEGPGEKWRIRPLKISIVGNILNVRGPVWLIARPILYQGVNAFKTDLDATLASNFAATLDVYRRYTSAGASFDTAQAVLIWETRPWPFWALSFPAQSTDTAGEAFALARVGIRDADQGIVSVGEEVYDPTTGVWSAVYHLPWWRPPDRVIVRYNAGIPLTPSGRVESFWKMVVSRLAAAETARRICACDSANKELYRWQFDISRTSGSGDEAYGAVSADDLANPLGTRRGHIQAWKDIRHLMQLRGFSI